MHGDNIHTVEVINIASTAYGGPTCLLPILIIGLFQKIYTHLPRRKFSLSGGGSIINLRLTIIALGCPRRADWSHFPFPTWSTADIFWNDH